MPAVIFDIDGTLANCDHRRHFVENKPKDWKAFYDAMSGDLPNQAIVDLLMRCHAANDKIILCSGRPSNYRLTTMEWLAQHDIPYWDLYMRHEGDHRADYIVKRELLALIRIVHPVIHFVVDDRKQVVDMWRAEGLTCLQCAEGDF